MKVGLERARRATPPTNGRVRQPPTSVRDRIASRVDYRVRTLGLGIALALLAALLMLAYVNRAERNARVAAANVEVLVAGRDIPAGTPANALRERGMLVRQRVQRRTVVAGAITDRAQIEDRVAAETIYAGEQITTRRFRPTAEHGVRGELNGTARAMIVPGDPSQLLTGVVRSGDRVDVLATLQFTNKAGRQVPASRTILRDLLVVSAPGAEEASGEGTRPGSTIVLALTDAQAQKLFYAIKNGQWSLTLRPYGRAAETRVGVETAESVLGVSR